MQPPKSSKSSRRVQLSRARGSRRGGRDLPGGAGSLVVAAAALLLTLPAAASAGEATGSGAVVVVLRDNVTPFQKWGSRTFTELYLGGYAEATYLTEEDADGPLGKQRELLAALREAASRHSSVDLLLLAHYNDYVRVVEELDPRTRSRLRLVYNTGGGDAAQGGRWLALGAKAYVGHPGGNVAPIFYAHFLRAFTGGAVLSEAVESSNEETRRFLLEGPSSLLAEAVAKQAGQSPQALWRGTKAQLFGDATLTFDGTAGGRAEQ